MCQGCARGGRWQLGIRKSLSQPVRCQTPANNWNGNAGATVDFWGVVRALGRWAGNRRDRIRSARSHGAASDGNCWSRPRGKSSPFDEVILQHRIGFVAAGEASLFLRVSSAHRAAAFAASDWIVAELKKKVPIWKKPLFVRPEAHEAAIERMNWPNRLTLSRLALTVLFVLSPELGRTYGRTFALVLFVLGGVTDYFDGEIARRYGIVTKFGKLMDPLVGQSHDGGGFHLPGPGWSRPRLGGDDRGRARFFDYRVAAARLAPRESSCRRRSWGSTRLPGKSSPSFSFLLLLSAQLKSGRVSGDRLVAKSPGATAATPCSGSRSA